MEQRCPDCNNIYNTLVSFESANGKCHHCHGRGRYSSVAFGIEQECLKCHGTGICQTCHGEGETDIHDSLFDEPRFDFGSGASSVSAQSYSNSNSTSQTEIAPHTP